MQSEMNFFHFLISLCFNCQPRPVLAQDPSKALRQYKAREEDEVSYDLEAPDFHLDLYGSASATADRPQRDSQGYIKVMYTPIYMHTFLRIRMRIQL